MELEASKYDCPITPGMRRCKLFIEHDDPLGLNWEKYFDNVEKHPDNSFIIINNNNCYIMILNTGWVDILQAKNDDVIDEQLKIIEKVINDGVSQ